MHVLKSLPLDRVQLKDSVFTQRAALNRKYLLSLQNHALLQNFYLEAGLWQAALSSRAEPHTLLLTQQGQHWGWETPSCQVRGHFLGHWLSAAAKLHAGGGDAEVKAKADTIVSELGRCQRENGGEWAGSIPEKYLEWIARGKGCWAPHYTLHKTLMGLIDMAAHTGSAEALDIVERWARWFTRWTARFTRAEMDAILDNETGGMMEAWADLFALTRKGEHLELMRRYERRRLFEPLLAGEDVLTNRHANTTIPEAHGAARACEVTGEKRYRDIAEAYWRLAVTERGGFCTGGQTSGEVWNPPHALAARLGGTTQEHCTVYNMIRLADYLYRWSGAPAYADYSERNLYNGILAQQHPDTGQIAYFLPLEPGARKTWGSATEAFWCCHGSLVQAHSAHQAAIYHEDANGLAITQFIPSRAQFEREGVPVEVEQTIDPQNGSAAITSAVQNQRTCLTPARPWVRPGSVAIDLAVRCKQPLAFALSVRLPEWLAGPAAISVNGTPVRSAGKAPGFQRIRRTWRDDRIRIVFPKALTACPLPDAPSNVAFLDGPVVLAGLCDGDRTLHGDPARPDTLLAPDNEREWGLWKPGYRTRTADPGIRFIPLHDVRDERYTVYFPIAKPPTKRV